jgi:hypothetical protein
MTYLGTTSFFVAMKSPARAGIAELHSEFANSIA